MNMTPAFALTLSFDGISLLRRVPTGWARVGDVALDADDLRGALADLRTEADTLSPTGGQVKLVIPNEQIKYLALPDTGLSGQALTAEIRSALDGATPYAVDDLTFDWVQKNGSLYVAAVANETLDEAEAFAKSHHFEPVSFAANAPDGDFVGEVFFGAAASWSGAAPEKDDHPFDIVTAVDPEPNATTTDTDDPDTALADLVEDTSEDLSLDPEESNDGSEFKNAEENLDERDALAPGAADEAEAEETLAPETITFKASAKTPDDTPAPVFGSIRASRDAPPTVAHSATPAPAVNAPDAPVTSRLRLGGVRKSSSDSDVTAPVLQVETSDAASDRKISGFFSRRKPAETPSPPAEPPVSKPKTEASPAPKVEPPKHDPAPARAAVARIAAMRAGRDTDMHASSDQAAVIPDERERMTIFGARTEPQVGGKPRFLGLMLTSALLIFLLAVAAWASVFLDEGISRFFDRNDETPSIARMPDVELAPLDGSITEPLVEEDGVQLASLEQPDISAPAEDGLSDLLPPPAAMTPEEIEATYAATGIWLHSPEAPSAPTQTSLDDLYIASIDGRVEQFDAVALPSAQMLRNDEAYLSQPNPSLPGTRYELDQRGLVVATPEGTVNPEGVRVFAGLPPVVPPARPNAPEVVPQADDAETVVNAALQAFRPRTRPGGLLEGNERAQLGGRTRAELAALRPNARPATIKAVEEEAQPEATQFAVAQSVAPVTRPRNFSRIVARAQELRQVQSTQVTQVASIAPRTVQPRIPSSANVARQATVTNAINLRRINLIGVYGKPSSRRALVRLSNGRYQKVQVGDRLDGGRVAAIGNSELRYTKNGRNIVLDMPDG
ncbi:hypothetical protein [Marivita hallyeonensis]|uniref:Type IV pilus biogenesis protein PilP n=1 Tax=Marivita hallyeonensis TaxID=996342 RepID=A0A1M5VMH1_9RHOB|nr:hypothetical protein [Marivita hallyeonensis]SHH76456.1 hypothetical protein SAMN05443551_2956 [Marivita hallyeonensis]